MTRTASLTARSWGRICLFGEHQDYLALPVVAAAVNLHMTITGVPIAERCLRLDLPDTGEQMSFPLDTELPYAHVRDYLPAALNVLRREGVVPASGWRAAVHGTIPINAGTSSSSALVVAWLKFLLAAAGVKRTPAEIAILANRAEVLEFGEPGGLMDHYLSALGGVYFLDFAVQPARVERLRAPLSGFVLGNSLEPKTTTAVLGEARKQAETAFAWVAEHAPDLDPRTSPRAAFASLLPQMPPVLRRKLEANLINRDLCRQGRAMLLDGPADPPELGRMLLEHHTQLSEGIGVSTPKLDRMVQAAVDAGALGGKLNGSGGGGCMYAYAPGHEQAVAAALEAAGGKAYVLTIPEGPG
jgi:galactokinase